jgi:hypothetical protein
MLSYPVLVTSPPVCGDKTTKLILLDSLLQEIGDACLHPPPWKWIRQPVFQIASNAEKLEKSKEKWQSERAKLHSKQLGHPVRGKEVID